MGTDSLATHKDKGIRIVGKAYEATISCIKIILSHVRNYRT